MEPQDRVITQLLVVSEPVSLIGYQPTFCGLDTTRLNGRCGLLVTGRCEGLGSVARFGAMAGFSTRRCIRARVFRLEKMIDSQTFNGDRISRSASRSTAARACPRD